MSPFQSGSAKNHNNGRFPSACASLGHGIGWRPLETRPHSTIVGGGCLYVELRTCGPPILIGLISIDTSQQKEPDNQKLT
jgi:hypothetical protein